MAKVYVHESFNATNSFNGPVITAKKGIRVKELKPIVSMENTNPQALDIFGENYEQPTNIRCMEIYG